MASWRNLQASVSWVLPHLRYQPFSISNMQPALDSGNVILQTMLGPPFKWPWNRAAIGFTAQATVQDYKQAVGKFGFLESGVVIDPATSKPTEISIKNSLELDAEGARPAYVSPQLDDNAGNITFRLLPCPNVAYPVSLTMQQKAPIMTSLASTWWPIPDELSYIYDHGMLSLGSLLNNDPRFQVFNQRFVAHLLGRQGGLSDTERNIFLQNWLQVTSMMQASQLKTQQSVASRQS